MTATGKAHVFENVLPGWPERWLARFPVSETEVQRLETSRDRHNIKRLRFPIRFFCSRLIRGNRETKKRQKHKASIR